MMLKILRSNQPYFNIIYILLSFGLTVPLLISDVQPEVNAMSLLANVGIPAPFWKYSIPFVIVLGALLVNRFFNRNEFHQYGTQVPGLAYILTTAGIAYAALDPAPAIANIFLLMALQRQVKIFRQPRVARECFDTGLWLGLASLIYFPLVIGLAALFSALISARTFKWREYLLGIMGFGLSWIWLFATTYIFNFEKLSPSLELSNLTFDSLADGAHILMIGFLVLGLWGLVYLVQSFGSSSNNARNTKSSALSFCFVILLSFLLGGLASSVAPWALLAIPISLTIPYLFLDIKSDLLLKSIFGVFVLLGLSQLILYYLP